MLWKVPEKFLLDLRDSLRYYVVESYHKGLGQRELCYHHTSIL